MSRSIYSIFFILSLAHVVGCDGSGAGSNPDAGIAFGDADVLVDVSVPDPDLGVIPDSDSGVEDVGTDLPDAQVEPDLGSFEDDLGVPPGPVCGNGVIEDGETCDDGENNGGDFCEYGVSSCWICNEECSDRYRGEGPIVHDFDLDFPDGEAVYYVWLPDLWVDFEQAEEVCSERGGHAVFVPWDSDDFVNFVTVGEVQNEILNSITPPPSHNCDYPVEEPTFNCDSHCNQEPFFLLCASACYSNVNSLECDFRRAYPDILHVVHAYTVGHPRSIPLTDYFYKVPPLVAHPDPVYLRFVADVPERANIICLIPKESGDFTTQLFNSNGNAYEYTFERLCSISFSALNGATCP